MKYHVNNLKSAQRPGVCKNDCVSYSYWKYGRTNYLSIDLSELTHLSQQTEHDEVYHSMKESFKLRRCLDPQLGRCVPLLVL